MPRVGRHAACAIPSLSGSATSIRAIEQLRIRVSVPPGSLVQAPVKPPRAFAGSADCGARVASGHAAAQPRRVMKSQHLIPVLPEASRPFLLSKLPETAFRPLYFRLFDSVGCARDRVGV